MCDVSIITDIEIPFTCRERAFCVLEYARSQSNKTVHHAFMRDFSKQSPTAMKIWTWHTQNQEGRLFRKGSGRPKTSEEMIERVRKKSCKVKRNRYEEQVW